MLVRSPAAGAVNQVNQVNLFSYFTRTRARTHAHESLTGKSVHLVHLVHLVHSIPKQDDGHQDHLLTATPTHHRPGRRDGRDSPSESQHESASAFRWRAMLRPMTTKQAERRRRAVAKHVPKSPHPVRLGEFHRAVVAQLWPVDPRPVPRRPARSGGLWCDPAGSLDRSHVPTPGPGVLPAGRAKNHGLRQKAARFYLAFHT